MFVRGFNLTENAAGLHYKDQPVNVVYGNNSSLLREKNLKLLCFLNLMAGKKR
jgi:hypothetical protein